MPSSDRPSPSRPRLRAGLTYAMAAGLAVATVLLLLRRPGDSLLSGPHGAWLALAVLAVTAAFVTAELGTGAVELRRRTYAYTLTGVPLVVGVLFLPVLPVLLARVLGLVVAGVRERQGPLRLAVNSSLYALDVALVAVLLDRLLPPDPPLDLRTAGLVLAVMVGTDLLNAAVVLTAVRLNEGPVPWSDARQSLVPGLPFVALEVVLALAAVVLLSGGILGVLLLGLLVAIGAVLQVGGRRRRRQHRALAHVQQLMQPPSPGTPLTRTATDLLHELRTAVRAREAHLVLDTPTGPLRASAGRPAGHVVADPPAGASGLLTRRRSAGAARWLADADATEAVVVAARRGDAEGRLVLLEPLDGRLNPFSDHDVRLAGMLLGHVVETLRAHLLVEQLQRHAMHDELTGLANRRLLLERTTVALRAAGVGARQGPVRLLLLDLDGFKQVNDSLGHDAGDRLLRAVADRLSHRLAGVAGATVARLGGDEFAVLLAGGDAGDTGDTGDGHALVDVSALALALESDVREPVDVGSTVASVGCSVGRATAEAGWDATTLLRAADVDMYERKRQRRPA